jgi:hypothetical protein
MSLATAVTGPEVRLERPGLVSCDYAAGACAGMQGRT